METLQWMLVLVLYSIQASQGKNDVVIALDLSKMAEETSEKSTSYVTSFSNLQTNGSGAKDEEFKLLSVQDVLSHGNPNNETRIDGEDGSSAGFSEALAWMVEQNNTAQHRYHLMPQNISHPTLVDWVSLLHYDVVGQQVVNSRLVSEEPSLVMFAHCTQTSKPMKTNVITDTKWMYKAGAVTVWGINSAEHSTQLTLLTNENHGQIIHLYILTTKSGVILLNGQEMESVTGNFPKIQPYTQPVNEKLIVSVPMHSIFYLVLPDVRASVCLSSPAENNNIEQRSLFVSKIIQEYENLRLKRSKDNIKIDKSHRIENYTLSQKYNQSRDIELSNKFNNKTKSPLFEKTIQEQSFDISSNQTSSNKTKNRNTKGNESSSEPRKYKNNRNFNLKEESNTIQYLPGVFYESLKGLKINSNMKKIQEKPKDFEFTSPRSFNSYGSQIKMPFDSNNERRVNRKITDINQRQIKPTNNISENITRLLGISVYKNEQNDLNMKSSFKEKILNSEFLRSKLREEAKRENDSKSYSQGSLFQLIESVTNQNPVTRRKRQINNLKEDLIEVFGRNISMQKKINSTLPNLEEPLMKMYMEEFTGKENNVLKPFDIDHLQNIIQSKYEPEIIWNITDSKPLGFENITTHDDDFSVNTEIKSISQNKENYVQHDHETKPKRSSLQVVDNNTTFTTLLRNVPRETLIPNPTVFPVNISLPKELIKSSVLKDKPSYSESHYISTATEITSTKPNILFEVNKTNQQIKNHPSNVLFASTFPTKDGIKSYSLPTVENYGHKDFDEMKINSPSVIKRLNETKSVSYNSKLNNVSRLQLKSQLKSPTIYLQQNISHPTQNKTNVVKELISTEQLLKKMHNERLRVEQKLKRRLNKIRERLSLTTSLKNTVPTIRPIKLASTKEIPLNINILKNRNSKKNNGVALKNNDLNKYLEDTLLKSPSTFRPKHTHHVIRETSLNNENSNLYHYPSLEFSLNPIKQPVSPDIYHSGFNSNKVKTVINNLYLPKVRNAVEQTNMNSDERQRNPRSIVYPCVRDEYETEEQVYKPPNPLNKEAPIKLENIKDKVLSQAVNESEEIKNNEPNKFSITPHVMIKPQQHSRIKRSAIIQVDKRNKHNLSNEIVKEGPFYDEQGRKYLDSNVYQPLLQKTVLKQSGIKRLFELAKLYKRTEPNSLEIITTNNKSPKKKIQSLKNNTSEGDKLAKKVPFMGEDIERKPSESKNWSKTLESKLLNNLYVNITTLGLPLKGTTLPPFQQNVSYTDSDKLPQKHIFSVIIDKVKTFLKVITKLIK